MVSYKTNEFAKKISFVDALFSFLGKK